MDCVLIFDHLNDIVFSKYNKAFLNHIITFAKMQGLIEESCKEQGINNVIVQIFTPIVTSHRIMNCQFGNSYDNIQCEDGLIIHFLEYMGYLFIVIGDQKDDFLKKKLYICVVMVRYLCGPDVYQLKTNKRTSKLVHQLIDSWIYMQNNSQATLIEAIEQLSVNSEISGTAIKILKDSVEKLASHIDSNKIHALILIEDKLFCLYSSQNAKELSPTDILLLTILCHNQSKELDENMLTSYQILLFGPERQPKCLPHVVHKISLFENVCLVYLIEIGNPIIAASIYEAFCHLHIMQQVQIQRNKETLQLAFENLDIAIKKLNESLKKNKNSSFDNSHKQLMKKWDIIKKKYQEYLKNSSNESLLRAETLSLGFLENLKELLNLSNINESVVLSSEQHVKEISSVVKEKLNSFGNFLTTKSIKNFSLGSYMEEFPGLVHFLYVDRTTHRVTTPTLDCQLKEELFTKKKVWFMVNFARRKLREGIMSLVWKDCTFTYAYFLWFEDYSGTPLKPVAFSPFDWPQPGILWEDCFEKLKELCFPKMCPTKIKCYELFCIHLGLVTASCVLEQTRRLSATVWELKGLISHAIDLL